MEGVWKEKAPAEGRNNGARKRTSGDAGLEGKEGDLEDTAASPAKPAGASKDQARDKPRA
jgi:hypothetical protein